MKRWLIGIMCAVTVLSGCGFHLRGKVELAPSLSAIYIKEPVRTPLRLAVRNAIIFSGGNVVEDEGVATATLNLRDTQIVRRVRTVDLNGKATGYTLTYTTVFDVVGDNGDMLVPPKKATASRSMDYNATQVLASNRESKILAQEMEKDISQQIIRNLGRVGHEATK